MTGFQFPRNLLSPGKNCPFLARHSGTRRAARFQFVISICVLQWLVRNDEKFLRTSSGLFFCKAAKIDHVPGIAGILPSNARGENTAQKGESPDGEEHETRHRPFRPRSVHCKTKCSSERRIQLFDSQHPIQ